MDNYFVVLFYYWKKKIENNKYEARPRRSLRAAGLSPSPGARSFSPHAYNESSDSKHSDDEFGQKFNSSDLRAQHELMDSTRSSDRSDKFIRYESITTTKQERYRPNSRDNSMLNHEKASSFKKSPSPPPDRSDQSNTHLIITGIIVAIIAGTIGAYALRLKNVSMTKSKIECPQFKELSKKFTHQDKQLWKELKIGIENVINGTPAQPSVFLLAYNDQLTSKNVMAQIVNATAQCLQSHDPIELDGGTFVTDRMLMDYGQIIEMYRKRLEDTGIMYVADIHKVPGQAAQAFHTICDTVTPFVERSVIFFTMYVNQYDHQMSDHRIRSLVEEKLEHNWDDINHDTLNALIGRVTYQVFFLHPESNFV